ncbi:unnamed protein product [Ceutorhynchus assimilis]|uniref:Uncharacterized protein n=1 Tax=Ceutorhynchus assimilis TaxID=467358 RepID=A0A9N9MZ36_9CUCU|nr:unnamed protein product [Ceutorhynchus assimilis]
MLFRPLMYRFLVLLIIFVLLWKIFILFGGIFSRHDVVVEQYNNQLKELSRLMGVGKLHKFVDNDDIEANKTHCTNGLYLGDITDPSTNCSLMCGSEEFHFKHIGKNDLLYIHDVPLRMGGWCLPTDAANCNYSTTVAVKILGSWSCLSRYSEFGGPVGNLILVCNGQITDNLYDEQYITNIPSTLVMSGPDEKLEDGSWRFTCTSNIDPVTGNIYKTAPWSHLEQIRNVCVKGLHNAVDIDLNWETGECDCKKYNLQFAYGKCIVCLEGEFKQFSDYPYRYNVPLDCDDYEEEFEPGKIYTNMPCASSAYNCVNMPLDYSFGNPIQLYWQRIAMNTEPK